jgi:large subunit ribosomal protein L4
MNKKARRAALYSALSAKVAEGNLIVVDDIKCAEYKTKTMVNMINALGGARKPMIVLPEVDALVVKSCANIPGAKTTLAHTINVYDILNADKFIATRAAIEKLEEVFA